MTDHGLRYRKGPGLVAKVLGSVGIAALVHSLEDQEVDAADPKVVAWTERSDALRRRALELAASDADDEASRRGLAAAAGRHPRELRRAAAALRQGGRAAEDETWCRAERLLVAAAGGRPVEPLTGQERAWFDRVRDLGARPTADAFAALVVDEPALAELEDEVRRMAADPAFAGLDVEGRDGTFVDTVAERMHDVVGGSSSPLVRTRVGWDVAWDHLRTAAGLAPPDDGGPPGADHL